MEHDETSTPKYLNKQFMKADLTALKEKYTAKVMRGYYERKFNNDTQIDKHLLERKKINLLRHNRKNCFLQSATKNYSPNILDTKELETVEKTLIVIINVDFVLQTLKN